MSQRNSNSRTKARREHFYRLEADIYRKNALVRAQAQDLATYDEEDSRSFMNSTTEDFSIHTDDYIRGRMSPDPFERAQFNMDQIKPQPFLPNPLAQPSIQGYAPELMDEEAPATPQGRAIRGWSHSFSTPGTTEEEDCPMVEEVEDNLAFGPQPPQTPQPDFFQGQPFSYAATSNQGGLVRLFFPFQLPRHG